MSPWAEDLVPGCGHESHIVKMHYFFKKLLLYCGGWIRQTHKDNFDDVPIDSFCMTNQVTSAIMVVDFKLFYDGAVDM